MLIGGLEAFLTEWRGPSLSGVEVEEGPWPYSLRHWHACAEAWDSSLTYQNVMRPLREVDMGGEVAVFYDENQYVCSWGFGRGDDPEVLWRYNHEPDNWKPAGEQLNSFLHHLALYEAPSAAPLRGLSAMGMPKASAGACGCFGQHPTLAGCGPDSRVYLGDDVVALAGSLAHPTTAEDDDDRWWLFIAGRTVGALSPFDQFGLDWA